MCRGACVFKLLEKVIKRMWLPTDSWTGPGSSKLLIPSLVLEINVLPEVPSPGVFSRTRPLWPIRTVIFDLSGMLGQKKLKIVCKRWHSSLWPQDDDLGIICPHEQLCEDYSHGVRRMLCLSQEAITHRFYSWEEHCYRNSKKKVTRWKMLLL